MIRRRVLVASAGLGFAFGGFFDGILLHQILQWHHLLSLVAGAGDLAAQVMWDGYFHAAMYVIAAISLWVLWRLPSSATFTTLLPAGLLIGFGVWHIVDGVLSHWVLQIHRIRLDTQYPLAWDIGWMAIFGVVPLAAGWRMLARRTTTTGHATPRPLVGLTGLTLALGAAAAQPIPGADTTTAVVFARGGAGELFGALAATDGRLIWNDQTLRVALVDVAPDRRWRLYRRGAIFVGGAGFPAGCLTASRS
jgi:uncharacterized membrane protein